MPRALRARAAGGLAAAALTLAGLGAVTPSAGADEASVTAVTCDPGDACIVDNIFNVLYANPANANPNFTMPRDGLVWNRGTRFPGLDHIQMTLHVPSGRNYTICLHYGNTPTFGQPDPTAVNIYAGQTVVSWRWRGECIGDEDLWQNA